MSTPDTPITVGYRDLFDPDKQYEQLMFLEGRVPQTREFNEVQRTAAWRSASVADALFADGDLISGGGVAIAATAIQCAAAKVYVAGAVRDVPEAELVDVAMAGTVTVGLRLAVTVITEVDDPTLVCQAVGRRAYGEPGAARLKVSPYWSWSGADSTDAYYPIYTLDDGVLRPKEPPPQANAITQAIAKYDTDSSGGRYIVNGCAVSAGNSPALDDPQAYVVGEGRAYVQGFPIPITASIRSTFTPLAPEKRVNVEPHVSVGGTETFATRRFPVKRVVEVHVRKTTTVTVTRGAAAGTIDNLNDTSIESVLSVTQGATTYNTPADYTFNGTGIDWSPAGAEPAAGSTYSVEYVYIWTGAPDSNTATEVTVSGANPGSTIEVTYDYLVPRVDMLCLTKDGTIEYLRGTPADVTPWPPRPPANLLPLAKIFQTWDARRTIVPAGIAMVSMETLSGLQAKLDRLLMLTAQDRLNFSAQFRDQSLKKAVLSDPFLDDTLRDQGSAQTAAIVDGSLVLPVALAATSLLQAGPVMLDGAAVIALEQSRRTGSMLINPYMVGTPAPPTVAITPNCDHWVEYDSSFTSPVTRRVVGDVAVGDTVVQTQDVVSKIDVVDAATIRPLDILFEIHGFAPEEELVAVLFDSVPSDNVVAP